MTHQGAAGATNSPWPSGAAAVPPPPPPVAASARVATTTVSSIATVASVLLVSVLLATVIMSYKWILNASDRRTAATASPSGRRRRGVAAAARGGRTRGVDPEALRSLPVTVYRGGEKGDPAAAAVECAVCLAELEDGEEARFLPCCGHGFHAECVGMWLASHSTCPLCRLAVGKPEAPPAHAVALALPPVPPEPANRATNLPASVLLGLSGQGVVTAVTVANDEGTAPSAGTTGVLVIEIPAMIEPATPCDAAKSPGSAARLRSMRRLWSFGRQGAEASSSCACAGAGAGEGSDVEQGISVASGIAVVETRPTTHAAACAIATATQGASA
ncbi:hypothetical protein ACP4OV_006410 [Aristida adscensionis]